MLQQCRCRPGYFADDTTGGRCRAEIGELAASERECSGDGWNAASGRCVCDSNRYALDGLRECIKRECENDEYFKDLLMIIFQSEFTFCWI